MKSPTYEVWILTRQARRGLVFSAMLVSWCLMGMAWAVDDKAWGRVVFFAACAVVNGLVGLGWLRSREVKRGTVVKENAT